ncbi:hypothetical protein BDW22DRAFT_766149 [Trametopsis cervina]|nr:hypothetical protein BDW22DRAFT_766149 [Trametopsis cervina]
MIRLPVETVREREHRKSFRTCMCLQCTCRRKRSRRRRLCYVTMPSGISESATDLITALPDYSTTVLVYEGSRKQPSPPACERKDGSGFLLLDAESSSVRAIHVASSDPNLNRVQRVDSWHPCVWIRLAVTVIGVRLFNTYQRLMLIYDMHAEQLAFKSHSKHNVYIASLASRPQGTKPKSTSCGSDRTKG